MRVVHQLIAYFREHGALSEDQIRSLRSAGFLEEEEDAGAIEDVRVRPPDERDDDDDTLPGSPVSGRDSSYLGEKPKGIEKLCNTLQSLQLDQDEKFAGLKTLAGYVAPNLHWSRAVVTLRHSDKAELGNAIIRALDDHALSLSALSDSLDQNYYRSVLDTDRRQRTKAMSAYRAMMRTHDFVSMGKYAWILRHDQVKDVFNLIQAKRATLKACNYLFDHDIERLRRHLRGGAGVNLFWAFVVLRSAKLEDPWREARRKTRMSVSYLGQLWPPAPVLKRAALYAVLMAPNEVLSFLRGGLDVPEDARGYPPWLIPDDWTNAEEKHFVQFQTNVYPL